MEDIFGLRGVLNEHFSEILVEFVPPTKDKSHKLLGIFRNIKHNEKTKDKEIDIFYNFTTFVESLPLK